MELSGEFPVKLLCEIMGIQRSSFYSWKKRLSDPSDRTRSFVSHSLSSKRGDRMTYMSGSENLIELKQQHPEYRMILHSDQGSVYTSKAFNELLPMYDIVHSMSRAGTPTDNAAMEAINGWIKAELFVDLHVTGEKPVQNEIDEYILFFNEQRPAYSPNYLTPKQYRLSNSAVPSV